jgi:hypothetical protein
MEIQWRGFGFCLPEGAPYDESRIGCKKRLKEGVIPTSIASYGEPLVPC